MKIEMWPLDRLKEYHNHPRKNDHAVEAVATAIATFGFKVPVLARSSGEIVDGHLRFKAAKHLNLESVPVLLADDLTEDQVRAFRISVNKVAELAKWDFKLLKEELSALQAIDFDLSTIGFSEVDLDSILGLSAGSGKDPDEIPEPEASVCRPGDLWLLGDHLLYVGDSTVADSYRQLLEGSVVDLIWTDPPYNVNYSGKAGRIQNDNLSDKKFAEFLLAFYRQAFDCLKPGGPIYVAHADGRPGLAFRSSFVEAGFYFSTCLIWRKNQSTLGRSDYHFQHEPILYGWKPGSPHIWQGGRKRKSVIDFGEPPLFVRVDEGTYQIKFGNEVLVVTGSDLTVESVMPTIIEFDKPLQSESHPTMKPVALVEHCLLNSSKVGDAVLDCFGGSGTTLIACELRDRKARIIENDPHFADVIICRWQDFTGRTATLAGGASYHDLKETRENYAGTP